MDYTNNPGKYDEVCTEARETTKADGVILIVIQGEMGSGFSVQAMPDILERLPEILEYMAGAIRKERSVMKFDD